MPWLARSGPPSAGLVSHQRWTSLSGPLEPGLKVEAAPF
jgi:hypothetical protein